VIDLHKAPFFSSTALELWQFVVTNCTFPICEPLRQLFVCNATVFICVGVCTDWQQVFNTVARAEVNGLNVHTNEALREGQKSTVSRSESLDIDKEMRCLEMGNLNANGTPNTWESSELFKDGQTSIWVMLGSPRQTNAVGNSESFEDGKVRILTSAR
jgi:hypothetical protein